MKTSNKTKLLRSLAVFGIFLSMIGVGLVGAYTPPGPPNPYAQCTVVVNGENVGNTAVQTAITAANPGSTVCLTAGVYPEQLSITKPLTLEGVGYTLNGNGNLGTKKPAVAVIEPTSVAATATDLDTQFNLGAESPIIFVEGTTGVTIENLEVNGSVAGPMAGETSTPIGILFQGASGTVNQDAALYVEGSDAAMSIAVQSATTPSTVSIENSYVSNYQKNGVQCEDLGTTCNLYNDVITTTPTNAIAQNGVLLMYVDGSNVVNTRVSGDSYSASCDTENYLTACWMSSGILLWDAGNVQISGSTVSATDMGVVALSDGAATLAETANDVVSNSVFSNNYGYGLIFDSFNGTSTNNHFENNPVGLLVTDDAANSLVTSINDQFSNNKVNSEALQSPGSTFNENLVVETSGVPYVPYPISHFPHHFWA